MIFVEKKLHKRKKMYIVTIPNSRTYIKMTHCLAHKGVDTSASKIVGWADGFGSVFHFVPPSSFSKFSQPKMFRFGVLGGWVLVCWVGVWVKSATCYLFNISLSL